MNIFEFNENNIGKVIKGSELKNIDLYKITNKDECHNGFQYKTGINIDHYKFLPKGPSLPGGLHFCQFVDILHWIKYWDFKGYWVRKVKLDDNEDVYVEENKFKAHKITLSDERILINDFIRKNITVEICIKTIKERVYLIGVLPAEMRTAEICELAFFGGASIMEVPLDKRTQHMWIEQAKREGTGLATVMRNEKNGKYKYLGD